MANIESLPQRTAPEGSGELRALLWIRRSADGIAQAALGAALAAIKKNGGGLVEASPIIRWKAETFGNVSTHGTVSMFEKEGFRIVAPFSWTKFQTNVLRRRTI